MGTMADAPSRRTGLTRWSRTSVAAVMTRATAWTAAAGRRPYHVVVAAAALGLALGSAPRWAPPLAALVVAGAAAQAARAAGVRPAPMALLAATALSACA